MSLSSQQSERWNGLNILKWRYETLLLGFCSFSYLRSSVSRLCWTTVTHLDLLSSRVGYKLRQLLSNAQLYFQLRLASPPIYPHPAVLFICIRFSLPLMRCSLSGNELLVVVFLFFCLSGSNTAARRRQITESEAYVVGDDRLITCSRCSNISGWGDGGTSTDLDRPQWDSFEQSGGILICPRRHNV